jgi:hypothetical protein
MNNLSYGSTEWTGHQAVSRRKGANACYQTRPAGPRGPIQFLGA